MAATQYVYIHVEGGIVQEVVAPEGFEAVVVDRDDGAVHDPVVTAHHHCRCADDAEAAAVDRAAADALGLEPEEDADGSR